MINVGEYLEYRGGVQYCGGYHEYCEGLSWVPWGILSTVGDIMITWEISWVLWGNKSFVMWVPPWYWTPHGTHDIPHMHHDIPPQYSNYKGWYPPWYWTPPTVLISPTCIMISPTVLKITSTVLMISPRYWTPAWYSRFLHSTEHPPRYSRYPPHASWYPPRYWTPHTVLHTHYTGWKPLIQWLAISQSLISIYFAEDETQTDHFLIWQSAQHLQQNISCTYTRKVAIPLKKLV